MESTQLLTLSMITPKADIGFMFITPDLHSANKIEKRLSLSLGADVLTPVYSYLSLTEESEYITTEEEYAQTLDTGIRKDPAKLEVISALLRALQDPYGHWSPASVSILHRPESSRVVHHQHPRYFT